MWESPDCLDQFVPGGRCSIVAKIPCDRTEYGLTFLAPKVLTIHDIISRQKRVFVFSSAGAREQKKFFHNSHYLINHCWEVRISFLHTQRSTTTTFTSFLFSILRRSVSKGSHRGGSCKEAWLLTLLLPETNESLWVVKSKLFKPKVQIILSMKALNEWHYTKKMP